MKEHTPEPWKIGDGQAPFYAWSGQILAQHVDGEFILASCNQNYPEDAEVNALRIVACVNACRGLHTVNLENNQTIKQAFDEIYEQTGKAIEAAEAKTSDAIRERDEARAMVAELSDALQVAANENYRKDWDELVKKAEPYHD